jgi:hypothetical protein
VVLIVSSTDTCSPATGSALRMPQTPSEWLLSRYDRELRRAYGPRGDRRRIRHDRGSNFDRRIFDLIDDHPGTECERGDVECAYRSCEASWPETPLHEVLDPDTLLGMFEEIA